MFNILLSVNLYRCFHLQKYELPIRERDLLESSKIDILFQGIHKVLDCHVMFNIALSARMDEWNNEEKIGDILYALVSTQHVLAYCTSRTGFDALQYQG